MKLISLLFSEKIELFFNEYKNSFFISSFIIFSLLVFYNYTHSMDLEEIKRVQELTKIVNKFDNKNKNIDLLVTVVSLEKYINKNKIKILSMKLINKGFILELEGEYSSTIKVVDLIEKKSSLLKIAKMDLKYDKSKRLVNLLLDVKVLKKEKIYKNLVTPKLVNVFENRVPIKNKNEEKSTEKDLYLKVYAIIDNMVNINNHWFKKGETINNKKIVFIGKDFIELLGNKKVYKLWIYKHGIIR